MRKLLLALALLCGTAAAQPDYIIIQDATSLSVVDINEASALLITVYSPSDAGTVALVKVTVQDKDINGDWTTITHTVGVTLDAEGRGQRTWGGGGTAWLDHPTEVDIWARFSDVHSNDLEVIQ